MMQLDDTSDPKFMTLLQILRTMLTDYEKCQQTDKLLVVNTAATFFQKYFSVLVKI